MYIRLVEFKEKERAGQRPRQGRGDFQCYFALNTFLCSVFLLSVNQVLTVAFVYTKLFCVYKAFELNKTVNCCNIKESEYSVTL